VISTRRTTQIFKLRYGNIGYSGRRGFGKRPALLVIDLARPWADPTPTDRALPYRALFATGETIWRREGITPQ
jgi:hypothetical protein